MRSVAGSVGSKCWEGSADNGGVKEDIGNEEERTDMA